MRVGPGIEMTEDAQKFLDALREYGALLSAPAGGMIGFLVAHRRANAEANKMEADAEKAAADADAAQTDALTRQFSALIDGYEKRVADLTAEVEALRDEVRSLRKALDQRPRPERAH